jgi:hypothetical protein
MVSAPLFELLYLMAEYDGQGRALLERPENEGDVGQRPTVLGEPTGDQCTFLPKATPQPERLLTE